MKRLFFISLLFLVGFGGFSQNTSPKLSEFGYSLGVSNYHAQKFSFKNPISYAALNTNASGDGGVWYRRKFAVDSINHDYVFIQTGIEFTRRFGDVEHDSLSIRVDEHFLNLPLLVGCAFTPDDRFSYTIALGLNLGVLSRQNFFTPTGNGSTVTGLSEGSFADYTKLSLLGDIAINYSFAKRSIARIGIRTSTDFNSPVTSTGKAGVTSSYNAYGMYLGIGKSF